MVFLPRQLCREYSWKIFRHSTLTKCTTRASDLTVSLQIFSDGANVWTISSLNHEAYDNIIEPMLKLTSANVRHNNDLLTFEKPLITSLTYEQLLAENYSSGKNADNSCVPEFITPTAFKSSGSYVILPSLRLIFLSLARRFDIFYGIDDNDYESLAEEIERSITVSDYKLSGASFSLEGIRLPSFTGNIKIRIKGDEQFISYIRMLCRIAEFSGIGIKTAIGMGQVILIPYRSDEKVV